MTLQHTLVLALALFGSTLALPLLLALSLKSVRTRAGSLALVGGMWVAIAFSVVLQRLGGRPRPEAILDFWPAPPTFSLPSGHAAAALALAVTWGVLRPRSLWVGLPLALLIAGSRVALGHHHPSDVLLGAALGVGWGLASWGLLVSGWSWPARLGWLFPAQAALVVVLTGMAYLGYLPRALLTWPGADKVLHALLFGVLVFFATLLSRGSWPLPLALFGLATAEEVVQGLSARRTSDPLDLLADLGGMVLCYLVARMWLRRRAAPVEGPKSGETRGLGPLSSAVADKGRVRPEVWGHFLPQGRTKVG